MHQATLAFADYAELFSLQQNSFGREDECQTYPKPLWLRSSRGELLACCAYSACHANGYLRISEAIAPEYLLPALATKMPIWQLQSLMLEPCAQQHEWPEAFSHNGVHITCEAQGVSMLLRVTQDIDTTNRYPLGAEFYDADLPASILADVPFYLAEAQRLESKSVLELACGSGRVSLAFLEAGYRVTSLDHSASMLALFERRLRLLPAIVRRRARLIEADMSSFHVPERFDLILIPFRSLQMLTTPSHVEQCLACIKEHLLPRGRLIFQVTNALKLNENDLLVPETIVYEDDDPIDHSSFTKKTWLIEYDKQEQTITQGLAYEVCDSGGNIKRLEERLHYRIYTPEQIRTLLGSAGFTIEAHWGGFNQESLGLGEDQIVVTTCHTP